MFRLKVISRLLLAATHLAAASALVLAVCGTAQAVTMDWVTVGNPGNAADDTGYGAVTYTYQIGKYEVTNAQYAEFLNAVAATDTNDLYNTEHGQRATAGASRAAAARGSYTYSAIGGREDMPVNYVSCWDSLRFANWLHNGQPAGAQDSTTTEDGAYTLDQRRWMGAARARATRGPRSSSRARTSGTRRRTTTRCPRATSTTRRARTRRPPVRRPGRRPTRRTATSASART